MSYLKVCLRCNIEKGIELSLKIAEGKYICRECAENLDDNEELNKLIAKRLQHQDYKGCFMCPTTNGFFNIFASSKNFILCKSHRFCKFCFYHYFNINALMDENIFSCLECVRCLLFECRGCLNLIHRRDKIFPVTCKFHFYCNDCISQTKYKEIDCEYCNKMNDYDRSKNSNCIESIKFFDKLTHLLQKPLDFRICLHDKDIIDISFLYTANQMCCHHCSIILSIIKKKIDFSQNNYQRLMYFSKDYQIAERNRENRVTESSLTNPQGFGPTSAYNQNYNLGYEGGNFTYGVFDNSYAANNTSPNFYDNIVHNVQTEYYDQFSMNAEVNPFNQNYFYNNQSYSNEVSFSGSQTYLNNLNPSQSFNSFSPFQSAQNETNSYTPVYPANQNFYQFQQPYMNPSQNYLNNHNYPAQKVSNHTLPVNPNYCVKGPVDLQNPISLKSYYNNAEISAKKEIQNRQNSKAKSVQLQNTEYFENKTIEYNCSWKASSTGAISLGFKINAKRCSYHNEPLLFLRCSHDICIRGIEEIFYVKFRIMCDLIYNKDLNRLNQLSFNIGCASGCFVKNVFEFDMFEDSVWGIWNYYNFDDKLWKNIKFLFNGVLLKFDICKAGCGRVTLGNHRC